MGQLVKKRKMTLWTIIVLINFLYLCKLKVKETGTADKAKWKPVRISKK